MPPIFPSQKGKSVENRGLYHLQDRHECLKINNYRGFIHERCFMFLQSRRRDMEPILIRIYHPAGIFYSHLQPFLAGTVSLYNMEKSDILGVVEVPKTYYDLISVILVSEKFSQQKITFPIGFMLSL